MLDDFLSLNEIRALPPLEFAIADLLPRGGIFVIGGDPKFGKSVVLLDMALRGVVGDPAFGRFQQNYAKVLIVNIEGRHQGIKMREHMFGHLSEAVQNRIVISGKPIHLTLPNGVPNSLAFGRLRAKIEEHAIDMVVLDPLISFHSGDENNSQQMVALLDELRTVAEATKCAFTILHHTRKMGSQQTLEDAIEQGGAMLRGASGIFGAVDSLALLWKIDQGKKRLLTFSCRYARGDTSPIEMQMDKETWRMYPTEQGVPVPQVWFADNGSEDWPKYIRVFGLSEDLVATARRLA